jgi:hypothetical protein
MCNHLNLKILIHIFTLIMIIIIMRSENFVTHLDGHGGTQVMHHCLLCEMKCLYNLWTLDLSACTLKH